MPSTIPIVLFAYNRPDLLLRTLLCLRENQVPLLYSFSDGPRVSEHEPLVMEVRRTLRSIEWCEVVLCERETNLGLGTSILAGVTEVFAKHSAAIVFEDDLICVPGTYAYLCAALNKYRDDPRVMSVTGWTHRRVVTNDITNEPYFDGRAECWAWGTWSRAWRGMEESALTLISKCQKQGIDIYRYGADLAGMAQVERQRNIWAVRFLYLHILQRALCLRPPWSMVEHIGFDARATNASDGSQWLNPPLKPCPPLPSLWPEPVENPQCPKLWQKAYGQPPSLPARALGRMRRMAAGVIRQLRGRPVL
jgi:hypothetical protein